ncbi:MAG TPA: CRTAC1 family protein [Bryobacteraceae bacterium]|nr:CRTAC1 family protein [Bryobacteraceae bacterium]
MSPSFIAALAVMLMAAVALLVPQEREAPQAEKLRRTYERNKLAAPAAGGHASAPGSAPTQRSSVDDLREAALRDLHLAFEEMPVLTEKTYFGGAAKDHILEFGGAGVALLDYDADGLLDIYIVNGPELTADRKRISHRNNLYKNLGNWKFENVSRQSGVDAAAWGAGVCSGDYNGDGLIDLYVTNFGTNLLFRNNGDGTFSETGSAAGLNHSGWSTGCSFFDADGDGNLDLYVANYMVTTWEDVLTPKRTLLWRGGPAVMAGPHGLPAARHAFYHNEGHGRFSDRTSWLGLKPGQTGHGFSVLTTDYNADGWIDIFVANDSDPNYLFRNRGNGKFDEVGVESGAGVNSEGRAQAGMGASAGDMDGDGLLDLVVTTFAHDNNTLYRNLGGGNFDDASESAGLKARTFDRLGWGVASFDADLDGRPDLFFANGHIYPQVDDFPQLRETYRQKNQLLLNRGGRFIDVSLAAGPGLNALKSHRGLASGDLDNDGRQDLVITSMDDTPTVLRNRTRSKHHWVNLQLACRTPNAFCIGASVTIDAGGRKQIQEIRSGGSYVSQSGLRLHFGLGTYAGRIDVTVRMPGGGLRTWGGIETDRFVILRLDR